MASNSKTNMHIVAGSHAKANSREPLTLPAFHVELAPRRLPIWPMLLDDLCQPTARRLSRALGISERTIRRYNATGNAPRVALLALFWMSSWGRSLINAQALNDAQLAASYARALRTEIDQLTATVARLQAIGQFGAANEPLRHPPRPRPTR